MYCNTINDELWEYILSLKIVDTHEHLEHNDNNKNTNPDVLEEYLRDYVPDDLRSAGMKPAELQLVLNKDIPVVKRWNVLEPYWRLCKYTGYIRSINKTVKGLYGIDEINQDTIEHLNECFIKAYATDRYQTVLKEKSNIALSINDRGIVPVDDYNRRFFKSVFRMGFFLDTTNHNLFDSIMKKTGRRILDFADWIEAFDFLFDDYYKQGAVGVKAGVAYSRSLSYPHVTYAEAQADFDRLMKNEIICAGESANRFEILENYMFHYLLSKLNKCNGCIQIHTGLLAGNGNVLSNSNPELLNPLFISYPDVKFDIFHMGYPYHHTLSALAKMFSNVYIDLCWAHIISPGACIAILDDYLDAVPVNKIFAFGGDHSFVDDVYGHQLIARENVAIALSKQILNGRMSLEDARYISRRWFVDNPLDFFNISL